MKNIHKIGKELSITSDEEIKEGDFVVVNCSEIEIEEVRLVTGYYNEQFLFDDRSQIHMDYCKKIILTTDQDLVKDGVQAIPDEFLEWFVNNPSCESIEVADLWEDGDPGTHNSYQIIIPQEEPKQELERGITITHVSKQETLEEAAKNYGNSIGNKDGTAQFDFIRGAKWQAERMYGEEEVKKIAEEVRWQAIGNPLEFTKNFNKWFEQFKKK